jgi:hypothetical protein
MKNPFQITAYCDEFEKGSWNSPSLLVKDGWWQMHSDRLKRDDFYNCKHISLKMDGKEMVDCTKRYRITGAIMVVS